MTHVENGNVSRWVFLEAEEHPDGLLVRTRVGNGSLWWTEVEFLFVGPGFDRVLISGNWHSHNEAYSGEMNLVCGTILLLHERLPKGSRWAGELPLRLEFELVFELGIEASTASEERNVDGVVTIFRAT